MQIRSLGRRRIIGETFWITYSSNTAMSGATRLSQRQKARSRRSTLIGSRISTSTRLVLLDASAAGDESDEGAIPESHRDTARDSGSADPANAAVGTSARLWNQPGNSIQVRRAVRRRNWVALPCPAQT